MWSDFQENFIPLHLNTTTTTSCNDTTEFGTQTQAMMMNWRTMSTRKRWSSEDMCGGHCWYATWCGDLHTKCFRILSAYIPLTVKLFRHLSQHPKRETSWWHTHSQLFSRNGTSVYSLLFPEVNITLKDTDKGLLAIKGLDGFRMNCGIFPWWGGDINVPWLVQLRGLKHNLLTAWEDPCILDSCSYPLVSKGPCSTVIIPVLHSRPMFGNPWLWSN